MSHSQSMPDVHSAYSYVHDQANDPEVNSEPVDIAPLMVWDPIHGFSGFEFPNQPPQPSPEPTHSARSRHSPPPSFAASFDGEDADDDHTDGDYHARRHRGRAFATPSDEVLQGYLDFDNEDVVCYAEIRNDSSAVLTKVELYFLLCMHTGLKVNLGFWFACAFERVVRTDRPLILGPYITRLASRLFPLTFITNEFTLAFAMDPLDARCLDSMGLLVGTPSAPYLVPPGTTTPRDGRVFLRRATHPAAPPAAPSSAAVHDELHQMHDRLHSMEANISEILSYLRPGSSSRGCGRDCR
ncbi:hypothetical protein GQ457_03G023480 [Hibiscus cannabinus]